MRAPGAVGRDLVDGFVGEATGRRHRLDPVLATTGGPAGNAVLTAWTGLVLLVLFLGELLTLFDVRGLLTWHVAVGALLVPPALLKTATTGWRVVRYYLGHEVYEVGGPPPTLLRWLGPLVVASTLGLLGSGVLLILLGEQRGRQNLFSLLGFRVDWITVHQATFAVWCVATGVHLLARMVPALRLTVSRAARTTPVPGGWARLGLLVLAAVLAAVLAVVLVRADDSWQNDRFDRFGAGQPPPRGAAALPASPAA